MTVGGSEQTKTRVSWVDDGRWIAFPPVCVVTGEPAQESVRVHFDDTPPGRSPKWWRQLWLESLLQNRSFLLEILFGMGQGTFYVRLPASRAAAARAQRRFRNGWLCLVASFVLAALFLGGLFAVYYSSYLVAVPLLALVPLGFFTTGRGYKLLLANDVDARRYDGRMQLTPHPRFCDALVRANPPGTVQVGHLR